MYRKSASNNEYIDNSYISKYIDIEVNALRMHRVNELVKSRIHIFSSIVLSAQAFDTRLKNDPIVGNAL